jgi:ketosteroid isomerase-like protein
MTNDLPHIISTYQHAHDLHDTDAAIAAFSPDATVIDDGSTYTGTDEIRAWLDRTANEYTYARTLTGIDDHGDGAYTVRNHLDGDFPGGQVDLRYRFELSDGRIRSLHIAP